MVICIIMMALQEITNSGGKDTRPGAEYVLTAEELAIFARVFVCVRSVLIVTHISVARFNLKTKLPKIISTSVYFRRCLSRERAHYTT